jgi:cytosol aminopeptidase
VATLTGFDHTFPSTQLSSLNSFFHRAVSIALGEIFTGVFSVRLNRFVTVLVKGIDLVMQTSESLWEELHAAGEVEYDRFWRLPLDEDFGPQIYSSNADLCNVNLKPFSI